jgi:CBS domain containing-hemolysin-like protein
MTATDWLALGGVASLWLVAGFLALSETSLTSMNKVRAATLRDEGRRGAVSLVRLMEEREKFLAPVLLLVLVCHLGAATLLGVVFERFGGAWLGAVTVGQVVVVFVFIESAPKTWAILHSDRSALLAAPLVRAIVTFAPLRLLTRGLIGLTNIVLPGKGLARGPYVSEEELIAYADAAAEDEVIEQEERALIRSIIEFGDTVVREVMVPRTDMVAVEGRERSSDVLEVAIAAGYSRIPVYDQGIDDVVGIVFTKDLMRAVREERADSAVRDVARTANFVPENKRVSDLMREMQAAKFHMAIVLDEYSGTAGLVTLEDLIEELVGEIVDEFDVEEAMMEPLPNGDYRVNARMPLDEVNDLLHADFPEGDWETIGGLVFNHLGHVPSEGESVSVDGFLLRAEKVQGRRIGKVRISKIPNPADDVPNNSRQ